MLDAVPAPAQATPSDLPAVLAEVEVGPIDVAGMMEPDSLTLALRLNDSVALTWLAEAKKLRLAAVEAERIRLEAEKSILVDIIKNNAKIIEKLEEEMAMGGLILEDSDDDLAALASPEDGGTSRGVIMTVASLPPIFPPRCLSVSPTLPFDDAAIILVGTVFSMVPPPTPPSPPPMLPGPDPHPSSTGGRNGGRSGLRTFTPLIPGKGENLRYLVHSACIQLNVAPATAYRTSRRIGSCLEGRAK